MTPYDTTFLSDMVTYFFKGLFSKEIVLITTIVVLLINNFNVVTIIFSTRTITNFLSSRAKIKVPYEKS